LDLNVLRLDVPKGVLDTVGDKVIIARHMRLQELPELSLGIGTAGGKVGVGGS